jgi:hypothetical protein
VAAGAWRVDLDRLTVRGEEPVTGLDRLVQGSGQHSQLLGAAGEPPRCAWQLTGHRTHDLLVLLCGHRQLRLQPDELLNDARQVVTGVAVMQPQGLAAMQHGDIGRQIRLGRDMRPVGQDRDHPQAVREGLHQLAAHPILRTVNPPPSGGVRGGQPALPDHHQQHTALPQPTEQNLTEILPGRSGLTVQKHLILAEPPRELGID